MYISGSAIENPTRTNCLNKTRVFGDDYYWALFPIAQYSIINETQILLDPWILSV